MSAARFSTLLMVFSLATSDSANTSIGGLEGEDPELSVSRSDGPIGSSRTLRLELVHPRGSEGAELHVYNADLLNTSIPLEEFFVCKVVGGHLERANGSWTPVSDVILHRDLHADRMWQMPPELRTAYRGVLQTKIIFRIIFEVEGELSCQDRHGHFSNSLLIRYDHIEAFVVSLNKSQSAIDIILAEYKYLTRFKMSAHLLKEGRSKFLIRVSYVKPSVEATNAFMMGEVANVTEVIAKKGGLKVMFVRSTRICSSEREKHFLWPETPVGKTAVAENSCVDGEGVPTPVRRCLGDFFEGTFWSEAPKRPKDCYEAGQRAVRLRDISREKRDALRKLENEILKEDEPLKAVEILHVANTMKKYKNELRESAEEVSSVVTVVDAILRSDMKAVISADAISGSSSDILNAVDELVAASGPSEASTPLFSAIAVGVGVRGFAVYPNGRPGELTPILKNETLRSVLAMSPRVAAYLLQDHDDVGLSSTLFQVGSLFGSSNLTAAIRDPIIGLSYIRNGTRIASQNTTEVLLIFSKGKQGGQCSFWDFREGGRWSSDGCMSVSSSELPPNADACLCTHLTHFALLLLDHPSDEDYFQFPPQVIQEKDHHRFLRLLTLVGCSLSLFCLTATIVYVARWRRGVYRKIELNLLSSVALLDTAELVIAADASTSRLVCVCIGVLLHYSMLATFMWMLVAAALQSLKLSPGTILDSRRRAGNHLLLKVSIFAWGFSSIPVVSTLCCGTNLYLMRPKTAFCYPRGLAFHVGVLFPVSLTVFVNALVFAWILQILVCAKTTSFTVHGTSKRKRTIRRIRYCLFLFFLFGLNWIAGLFLEVSRPNELVHNILTYAFCTAATLHGSSLFIFIVACEPKLAEKLSEEVAIIMRKTNVRPLSLRSFKVSLSNTIERTLAMLQESESKEENYPSI